MEDQLIGVKNYYRYEFSVLVWDTITSATLLTDCIDMGCKRPLATYRNFTSMFYDLFHKTAPFLNDPDLVRKVESAFYEGRNHHGDTELFYKKSHQFLQLFKSFEMQLKKAGLFNPEIHMRGDSSDAVLETMG